MNRTVIRTNAKGEDLGEVDLLGAHTGAGTLHKAFSVFVFSPDHSKLLLQRRAMIKMLFAGTWANTCCSHPLKNETAEGAGMRRLQEEMGVSAELSKGKSFVYRAEDPSGKGVEHEFDTILLGTMSEDTPIHADPAEVMEWKWMTVDDLEKDMNEHPDRYAPWLPLSLPLAMHD